MAFVRPAFRAAPRKDLPGAEVTFLTIMQARLLYCAGCAREDTNTAVTTVSCAVIVDRVTVVFFVGLVDDDFSVCRSIKTVFTPYVMGGLEIAYLFPWVLGGRKFIYAHKISSRILHLAGRRCGSLLVLSLKHGIPAHKSPPPEH